MESDKLKPRPKRRWAGKTQWVVVLDTGRFGDWVVVETPSDACEADVIKMLTRTQRKKAKQISRTVRTDNREIVGTKTKTARRAR